jgi:hypothetical protein
MAEIIKAPIPIYSKLLGLAISALKPIFSPERVFKLTFVTRPAPRKEVEWK